MICHNHFLACCCCCFCCWLHIPFFQKQTRRKRYYSFSVVSWVLKKINLGRKSEWRERNWGRDGIQGIYKGDICFWFSASDENVYLLTLYRWWKFPFLHPWPCCAVWLLLLSSTPNVLLSVLIRLVSHRSGFVRDLRRFIETKNCLPPHRKGGCGFVGDI